MKNNFVKFKAICCADNVLLHNFSLEWFFILSKARRLKFYKQKTWKEGLLV